LGRFSKKGMSLFPTFSCTIIHGFVKYVNKRPGGEAAVVRQDLIALEERAVAMSNNSEEAQINAQQYSLQLIHALNAIATSLQESIRGEKNIHDVFQRQVVALGLRGGISELDENGQHLIFRAVAFPNPLRKIMNRFEKELDTRSNGYSVLIDRVDVYQKVTRDGQAVFVKDTSSVSAQVVPAQIKGVIKPLLAFLGGPPGIFAPLVYDGKIKGMLNIVGPNLTENDVPALQAFANQIAVALENTRLVVKLKSANEKLEIAYQKTLEGWVQALDLRDNETEGHTLRTAEVTVRLARFVGIPEVDLSDIRRGALLHDIGKMAIPDRILLKPGPLDADEWEVMKKHPQTAYNWLSSIEYLNPALDIPYCHHEHWDGGGYVQGLSGEEIPLWARIFSVVDVWDAMSSDRPYRKAIPENETLAYVRDQSGKLFDPAIAAAFLDLHAHHPELISANRD
jgi:putative nucleotidyltransferase with HDIG domain